MRITRIDVIPLNLPYYRSLATSHGVFSGINNVLVRVMTDAGLTGFGEASPVPQLLGETQESIIAAVRSYLAPEVVGLDPFDLLSIHRRMDARIAHNSSAKAAVDMAIHDLQGKAANQPLYNLWGGLLQPSFPTTMAIGWSEPENMVKQAAGYASEGYFTFEVKMSGNAGDDLERMRALLTEVSSKAIYIFDPNQAWSVDEAIHIGSRIDEFADRALFEQPVHAENLLGLAQIKRATGIRSIADESAISPYAVMNLIRFDSVDGINIKLMKAGGLFNARKMINLAETAGLFYRVDCMIETRLGNTAAAHLAGSSRSTLVGLDSSLHINGDVLTQGGMRIEEGYVIVPDGPGLGAEVNEQLFDPCSN